MTIRHQVAVGGRVVDAASQRPIPGARVRITGKGVLPAQEFTTTSAGYYYFLDLPDGTYELHAWHAAGGSATRAGAKSRQGDSRPRRKIAESVPGLAAGADHRQRLSDGDRQAAGNDGAGADPR